MPIALEHIAPNDWSAVQRLVERVSTLTIGTGEQSISLRFGLSGLTFNASQDSDTAVITHGLGRTPTMVVASSTGSLGRNFVRTFTFTSTNFSASAHDVDAARTGAETFSWIAIG